MKLTPVDHDPFAPQKITPTGQSPYSEETRFSGYEAVKNIPGSAANVVGSLVESVKHPIQTAKAVGNLGAGVVSKVIPGEQEPEKYADQVGEFIASRYGDMEAFKQTVMRDPVGVLSDLSSVLMAGGGAASLAPGIVGKVGKAVAKTGAAIDPINVATNTVKAASHLVPKEWPGAMYESTAKWLPSIDASRRKDLTRTALDEGIMPTTRGIDKIDNLITGLNDEIDGLITAADQAGVTIPRSAVYRELKKVRRELGGAKIDAPKDLRKIDAIVKRFDEYMKRIGKDSLTPTELQEFKKDAYKHIKFDTKRGAATLAENEAKKAMARAAKKELEVISPEIKDLNAREGRLLDLRPELERASNRIDNRNAVSLDTAAKIGAGGAVGGTAMGGAGAATGGAIGAIIAGIGSPNVRSWLAIQIAKYQKQGIPDIYIENNILPAMLREAGIQSGKLKRKSWVDPIERTAAKLIQQPSR